VLSPVIGIFENETVRDFKLKNANPIRISNRRGKVILQSWPQEKIRVVAKQFVKTLDREEGAQGLKSMDIEFLEHENSVEILAVYGKGLSLRDKIKERKTPKSSMDLTIFAPARLPVLILSTEGAVEIHHWASRAEVRSLRGSIALSDIEGPEVIAVCEKCGISIENIKASIRLSIESGSVSLKKTVSEKLFLESKGATVALEDVEGAQTWTLGDAALQGHRVHGRVEFRGRKSEINVTEFQG
jgi:hypothetical protein